MADKIFTDYADWDSGANTWGGTVPTTGDSVFVMDGSLTVDTGLPDDTDDVDYGALVIGPNFEGQLGTGSGTALWVGDITAHIDFQASQRAKCWLAIGTEKSSSIQVKDGGRDALTLLGAGTWDKVIVSQIALMTLESGPTYSNLFLCNNRAGGAGYVHVDASVNLDNARVVHGTLNLLSDVDTELIVEGDGVVNLAGTTSLTYPLIRCAGGTLNFHSTQGTITALHAFGGVVNCNGGPGEPRTITNAYVYPGGVLDLRGLGSTVTVTNLYNWGGTVLYNAA